MLVQRRRRRRRRWPLRQKATTDSTGGLGAVIVRRRKQIRLFAAYSTARIESVRSVISLSARASGLFHSLAGSESAPVECVVRIASYLLSAAAVSHTITSKRDREKGDFMWCNCKQADGRNGVEEKGSLWLVPKPKREKTTL